jgi:RNA polymerase sigma-70 factor (ECF subfamily)
MNASVDPAATFAALRPRLFSIAYRMLGTRHDAEDILQDAWLRWERSPREELRSVEAWLVTIVTRLSIDRLRAAKAEREHYVGRWLPEPLVELDERTPESAAELASDLSLAFLAVLERLAPEERAAFLLRQVFDHDYDEIAALLGKTEAACRQMVHRASERVQQERPRFRVPKDAHRHLLEKFMRAARSGDAGAIRELLADDVRLVGDGGGKASVVPEGFPYDATWIAKLFAAFTVRFGPRAAYRIATINGEPGLVRYVDGQVESVQAFETDGERIMAMYVVRNPDKLASIAPLQ